MARGLTHIRRGTASTLEGVHDARSQVLGNFILKRKEGRDTCEGTEDKSNVKMRESSIAEAADLSADLERVRACEGKAEVYSLLRSG